MGDPGEFLSPKTESSVGERERESECVCCSVFGRAGSCQKLAAVFGIGLKSAPVIGFVGFDLVFGGGLLGGLLVEDPSSQPPLTPRQGPEYRGRVPDANP